MIHLYPVAFGRDRRVTCIAQTRVNRSRSCGASWPQAFHKPSSGRGTAGCGDGWPSATAISTSACNKRTHRSAARTMSHTSMRLSRARPATHTKALPSGNRRRRARYEGARFLRAIFSDDRNGWTGGEPSGGAADLHRIGALIGWAMVLRNRTAISLTVSPGKNEAGYLCFRGIAGSPSGVILDRIFSRPCEKYGVAPTGEASMQGAKTRLREYGRWQTAIRMNRPSNAAGCHDGC